MSFPYTVQDFVDAYKTTGVTPLRRAWSKDRDISCLCPLATLACAKIGADEFNGRTSIYPISVVTLEILSITEGESSSFVGGVDGCIWDDERSDYDPDIFNIGRQVRLAVFPELLPLPLAPV
jgi:hypothetical protein